MLWKSIRWCYFTEFKKETLSFLPSLSINYKTLPFNFLLLEIIWPENLLLIWMSRSLISYLFRSLKHFGVPVELLHKTFGLICVISGLVWRKTWVHQGKLRVVRIDAYLHFNSQSFTIEMRVTNPWVFLLATVLGSFGIAWIHF